MLYYASMETYRSGRNGADSKSVYRFNAGTRVRIPPSPSFYNVGNSRIYRGFPLFFISQNRSFFLRTLENFFSMMLESSSIVLFVVLFGWYYRCNYSALYSNPCALLGNVQSLNLCLCLTGMIYKSFFPCAVNVS